MANEKVVSAYVKVSPKVSDDFKSKVEDAIPDGKSLGEKLGGGLQSAMAPAAAAIAATAAAATAATAAIAGAVASTASYGDNIDKMSQKMGMSAESYQEWDAVMQHCGTSMETMKSSMKTLANAAETGSEAFDRLGISQEEIANMSQEQLFERTISALQDVSDETERTYLAGKTLGRGATELGALLNTSAEDTQKMRDRVHELGGVMSDDAVQASAAFQDSLQDMQTAMGGLQRSFAATLLPAATQIMDGLQEMLVGNTEAGAEQIKAGVDAGIEAIGQAAPHAFEAAARIISAIGESIIANAPNVLSSMFSMLSSLIGSVRGNVPEMLACAGELFLSIATAIAQNAPQILSDLLGLLVETVSYVVSHVPEMLSAGVELFAALLDAIAQTDIVAGIGELVQGAINAVGEFVGEMFNAGANLIGGLVDGIASKAGELVSAAKGAVDDAVQGAKNLLGIASPSKVFMEIGGYTMEGMRLGIEADAGKARSAVEEAVGGVYYSAKSRLDVAQRLTPVDAGANADGGLLSEIRSLHADMLQLKLWMDGQVVGSLVAPSVNRSLGRMEAAYAR